MDDRTWKTISDLVGWLDENSKLDAETEKMMRVWKIFEEAGEVAQAVTGMTGQNPRKGLTHTEEDVQAELCDVIFTGMVALLSRTPDAPQVFAKRLEYVAGRVLGETG